MSVSVDPLFVNAASGDYKPTEANMNNIGATGLGVTNDIINIVRGANPDPGAYEFSIGGCTNPPIPGTVATTATNICANFNFTLSLTGNSIGTGLTFQWQSSPTNAAPWTNVGTAQTTSNLSTSQTVSNYYRCALTCNAGTTVFSSSIQVTSPILVSGTFTINGGQPTAGTNFQTFADAINYLQCGINGPVTLNVVSGSGPYSEQLKIDAVSGASSTNTITINGNGATLSFGSLTTTTTRHGIHLNGADYVRINNLIIDGTASSTAAWGIVLTAQADSNIVSNCTINIGNLTSTSTNYIGIVLNGVATTTATSGNNGNGNQFLNNTINGGYYNYYLYGNSSSTAQNINNVIKGGTLQDAYNYGVYAAYQSTGLVVDSLDITRPGRTVSTTAGGVFITTGTVGALIQRNKIHNLFDVVTTPTSTSYGIYIGTDATTANPTKVINNLIYNIGGNGISYGIYNTSGDTMQVYHNTIALNDAVATTGTAYGIYQTTLATGIDVKNNIFYVTRSGTGIKRCLYFLTSTTTFSSNNNVFYMNAGGGTDNKVAQFGTTSYTTLSDWQTSNTNAYDQLSYELDPIFTNAGSGDFKPTNSVMDSKGTPVGVLKDIVDSTRSTTTPDIGAYEFNTITAGLNFGAVSMVSPATVTSGCYSSSETVTIQIKNSSANAHNFVTNPVTVTVNVTGAITQTLTTIVNTGTLASDAILNVVLPGSLNMSTAGIYTFNANTTLTGDVNTANDAIIATTRTKIILAAGTAAASPTTFCGVGGTLPTLSTVGLTGASSLQWQESSTASTGFADISGATTSSFTVTNPITQNRFYRLVATCAGSSVISTDATLSFSNPAILNTAPATRCGIGTVNLGATASADASVNWYSAASGGIPLSTGNTFTTPSINATTTYYASAGTSQGSSTLTAGATWNQYTTLGAFQTSTITNASMVFDALIPITINSLDIYPSASIGTTFTIEVRATSGTGTLIASYTGVTTVSNSTTPSIAQTVPVNFVIPQGTNYVIGFSTNPSTWRGNVTNFPYPYVLPGTLNVQGSSFGTSPGTTLIYQYFFYNWTVSSGCESTRTAVTATIDNNPACGTLPVTITNFKGDKLSNTNKLSWTTLTEVNNAGFEIERSIDGTNFSSIGFIASAALTGNSSNALTYTFNDTKGFVSNSYYRLKQLDKDGKFAYSTIVLLKANKVKELNITQIYPNPTRAMLHVAIESPNNDKLSLMVTDVAGKTVLQKLQSITMGNNIIQLATNGLAAGSYFIKIVCANGCETLPIKFVKE